MDYSNYQKELVMALMVGGATPDAIDVMGKITVDMMRGSFSSIYAAIIDLYSKGSPFTPLEVSEKAQWDLADLVQLVKTTAGTHTAVKYYAKKVRQGYLLNESYERLGGVLNDIRHCTDESQIGEISDKLETVIKSLVIETDDKKPRLARDILNQYVEIIDQRFNGGEDARRLRFGVDAIDEVTQGVNLTDLIIIPAAPGMGKTEFMMKLVNGASDSTGGALVFSMEMDEYQLIERSISIESGLPISCARNPRGMDELQFGLFSNGMSIVGDKKFHVLDQAGLSANEIYAKSVEHKTRYPETKLICIDYVGLIELAKADRHDIAMGDVTRKLKQLAKEIKTPIILLAQITSKDVEKRTDKRPMASDIKDSSRMQDDADWIISPYRDEKYNSDSTMKGLAEILFLKARHGEAKTVYMGWKNGHFTEIDQKEAAYVVNRNEADQRESHSKNF